MLTRFDDEAFLDVNILNSNAMKQNLQQTALQKATQPVSRYIKTGLEQFDIHDTDETIQQQADDNTADLEDLHATKKKKDETIRDRFKDDLSDPTQIDDMLTSTTAYNSTGYLRGSRSSAAPSSSSAAAATLEEDEHEFNDTPPPESQIIKDINLNDLEQRAENI